MHQSLVLLLSYIKGLFRSEYISHLFSFFHSKRNEDFDQLYNLYLATTSEQDLMDKIKEICCDDSIEEPIKKEVCALLLCLLVFSLSLCQLPFILFSFYLAFF